jgi:hypothetical protein
MTDKQKIIFQGIVDGDVIRVGPNKEGVAVYASWLKPDKYLKVINPMTTKEEWDDYQAAYEVYESAPLLKALR